MAEFKISAITTRAQVREFTAALKAAGVTELIMGVSAGEAQITVELYSSIGRWVIKQIENGARSPDAVLSASGSLAERLGIAEAPQYATRAITSVYDVMGTDGTTLLADLDLIRQEIAALRAQVAALTPAA